MLEVMWHVLVSVTIRWGYMHGNALAFHVCCCLGDFIWKWKFVKLNSIYT